MEIGFENRMTPDPVLTSSSPLVFTCRLSAPSRRSAILFGSAFGRIWKNFSTLFARACSSTSIPSAISPRLTRRNVEIFLIHFSGFRPTKQLAPAAVLCSPEGFNFGALTHYFVINEIRRIVLLRIAKCV